jgi:signal transduction histidine kinase
MRSLSLKRRIGIFMTVLLVGVIGVLSAVAYVELSRSLSRTVDNTLHADVDAIVSLVESEDSLAEARKEIDAFLNPKTRSDRTMYRIWFDGQDDFVAASDPLVRWPSDVFAVTPPAPSLGEYEILNTQVDKEHYRLIWAKLPDSRQDTPTGRVINVVIATHSSHVIAEMKEFLEVLAILGGIVILGSLILTTWILRWGLIPVAKLTDQMDEISGEDVEQLTPKIPEYPSELRPFVHAWDHMLERLALAMEQQQRFTADASHQLRTPLTIVKSTLQTARSRRRSPDVYVSAIDEALEDLERLEHLIEQLLALAHLDDLAGPSGWRTFDLREVVSEICEQYAPLVENENVSLKWDLYSAEVKGNEDQIKILIANLVDNAIKYGPAGGEVLVSIRCLNGRVCVSVHDQGGNIPEREREHIFERFYRLRTPGQRTSRGSGLGLALAQEIAHKHQCRIEIISEPVRGTDFIVTLPLT